MPSLQIRNLPDDVYQALSERAQREGRSLAQQALTELRRLPAVAAEERRRATLDRLRNRGARDEWRQRPDPIQLVREDREA